MKPQKPRRGLFGGLRNAFSQQGLAQTNNAGVSRGEQLGAMLMSLAGPQQAMMAQQNLMGIRQDHRDMMRRQQERQGLQNTAQKQAMQERERLYAQADALGVNRGEFAMMPEETRNELFSRRYTPDQPDLPSSVREYEYARNQGFGGTFQNWQAQNPRGNSVTVNTGNQPDMRPQIGTIPQGFQARFDQQTGSYQMEPIPGSDPAMERQDQIEREAGRQGDVARAGGTVIQDLNRALGILDQSDQRGMFSGPAAGPFSGQFREMPGTPAYEINQLVQSALSNVGLDTLQRMRENSPTGGALGQVPIQQQQRLEQVLGSLDVRQSPDILRDNLNRVSNLYMDIVYGTPEELAAMAQRGEISPQDAQRYAQRAALSFDELGRPVEQQQQAPAPAGDLSGYSIEELERIANGGR